ncbi:peptidoglycan-binding protein [Philodulcilactobacillus myokoensis]|uniref:Peptidoglycan-binding protein n=1 Tax=Philodulcilactobacillus myokoensis TaxID=2929573 RepID=A0A9W6B1M7_9LACO|nr:LysM domain-containing protein [Philodulcilactobacillus myokoensis]GLB46891.1 peptidoglycan-binding protein [Philodulcilactobacillus myokoensis]
MNHNDNKLDHNKPWDQTFNSARNHDGHLSRVKLNRENHHNNLITVILVSIIIVIALVSLFFGIAKNISNSRGSSVAQSHPSSVSSKADLKKHRNDENDAKNISKKSSSNSKKTVKHYSTNVSENANSASDTSVKTSNTSHNSNDSSSNDNSNKQNSSSTNGEYATVGSGQGIYRVAENAGISMQQLMQLNHLSSTSSIHPGERLRVK